MRERGIKRKRQVFPARNFEDTIEFEFLNATDRHDDRFDHTAQAQVSSAAYNSHVDMRNPAVDLTAEERN